MWSYGRTVCKRNGLRRIGSGMEKKFSPSPILEMAVGADQIVSIGWESALIRCLGVGRYRKGAIYVDCAIVPKIIVWCPRAQVWRGGGFVRDGRGLNWSGADPHIRESFEGKWAMMRINFLLMRINFLFLLMRLNPKWKVSKRTLFHRMPHFLKIGGDG